jgi:hypothetical protein
LLVELDHNVLEVSEWWVVVGIEARRQQDHRAGMNLQRDW